MSAAVARHATGDTIVHPSRLVRRFPGEAFVPAVSGLTRKAFAGDALTRASDDPRVARGVIITTEHRDRAGDIVRIAGADLTNYLKNPIVELQHGAGPEFPVIGGQAKLSKTTVSGVPAIACDSFLFGDTPLGRDINSLWNDGILCSTSIGFTAKSARPIDADGNAVEPRSMRCGACRGDALGDPRSGLTLKHGGPDGLECRSLRLGTEFLEWELYEFSIVAIPMNPEARRKVGEFAVAKAFLDLGAKDASGLEAPGEEAAELIRFQSIADLASQATALLAQVSAHAAALVAAEGAEGVADEAAEEAVETARLDAIRSAAQAVASLCYSICGCCRDAGPEFVYMAARLDASSVGRLLKETSLERCDACASVVPYHRGSSRFVTHRAADGALCSAARSPLLVAPTGPTLKELSDEIRNSARADAIAGMLARVERAGAVLSGANMADLREAKASHGSAMEHHAAVSRALDRVLDRAKKPESDAESVTETGPASNDGAVKAPTAADLSMAAALTLSVQRAALDANPAAEI